MKKLLVCILLVSAVVLTACGNSGTDQISDVSQENQVGDQTPSTETPEVGSPEEEAVNQVDSSAKYDEIIEKYTTALSEKWDYGKLLDNNMSPIMSGCYEETPYENIGYALTDLDNDGTQELFIGATEKVTDDFYGKMVFDLYTLDQNGEVTAVLTSGERNRYYYAGNDCFANMGSNSASDSVETTLRFGAGVLTDTESVTAPTDYVQAELKSLNESGKAEELGVADSGTDGYQLTLPILDVINESISVGTDSSSPAIVQTTVQLLDWGVGTGLDPIEIKDAAVVWINSLGNDEQSAFIEKLTQVDEAYQKLLGTDAEELLSSAGCEDAAYPWSDAPVESIEAIMEAAGLR